MKKIIFLGLSVSMLFATTFSQQIEEGVEFYHQKQYERALAIFDRILIEYPNSKRARLEYARVLYAMGRYDESKKEFNYVLKQNPPKAVSNNIKWFLKKIDEKKKTNFYRGFISLGMTTDNNIENRSDHPACGSFVSTNTDKRKDRYITAELGFTHTKKLTDGYWKNSLYLMDELNHDESSDKISYLGLTSSYIFFNQGIRVELPISLGYLNIDKSRYLNSVSFSPNITKKVDKKNTFKARVSLEKNSNKLNKDRDTKVFSLGAKWFWKAKYFSNMIGLTYKDYKALHGNRSDVAKKRRRIDLATSYPLSYTNFLNLFYSNTVDKYKEETTCAGVKRVDRVNRINFSWSKEIYKNRYIRFGIAKVRSRSNIDFYSYDKKIISIKATQSF